MSYPVFESERLHMRPLEVEDAPVFFASVRQDVQHLQQWLPWVPEHHDQALSESFIESSVMQLEIGNGGLWGVFNSSGALLGTVTIHWIQWDHRSASIGYWLLSPYIGQGYAQEAVNALLRYCFDDLELNRVECSAAVENERSCRLLRRLGFQGEGIRRQLEFLHGHYLDHEGFSMLRQEWQKAQDCIPK